MERVCFMLQQQIVSNSWKLLKLRHFLNCIFVDLDMNVACVCIQVSSASMLLSLQLFGIACFCFVVFVGYRQLWFLVLGIQFSHSFSGTSRTNKQINILMCIGLTLVCCIRISVISWWTQFFYIFNKLRKLVFHYW